MSLLMVSARFTLRNWFRSQPYDTPIPIFSPLLSNLRPRARPSAMPYVLPVVDDLLYISNVTKLVLPLVHVYVISASPTKTQSVFRVLGQ